MPDIAEIKAITGLFVKHSAARIALSKAAAKFEESAHPRGPGGKFTSKGGKAARYQRRRDKAKGDRRHKALERVVDKARAHREMLKKQGASQEIINRSNDHILAAIQNADSARRQRVQELLAERRAKGSIKPSDIETRIRKVEKQSAQKPGPRDRASQRELSHAEAAAAYKEHYDALVKRGAPQAEIDKAKRLSDAMAENVIRARRQRAKEIVEAQKQKQAKKDARQAKKDANQAKRNARKDAIQARKDARQAKRDANQAERDAKRDARRAKKEANQAKHQRSEPDQPGPPKAATATHRPPTPAPDQKPPPARARIPEPKAATEPQPKLDPNARAKQILADQREKMRRGGRKIDLKRVPAVPEDGTLPDRARNAGSIGMVPTDDIQFDPDRFQYKLERTSKTGSVGSLAGVTKWDKDVAGVLLVWKDHADGKTYVVNGHNRLDLAKKLGVKNVGVRYLEADDARVARAKGAFANIAEGRGTSVDAAKFMRDTFLDDDPAIAQKQHADLTQKLKDRGIPLTEGKTREGIALAGLSAPDFHKVVHHELPTDKAAVIGGSGLPHDTQHALVRQYEKMKGNVTTSQLREWVDDAHAAGSVKQSQSSLFGNTEEEESLFMHRSALNAHVSERLGREKRLFGTVSKKRAARELTQGGNVIDADTSGKISQDAAVALDTFRTLKRTSTFSASADEAARRMAEAKNDRERSQIRDDYYERVKRDVQNAHKF